MRKVQVTYFDENETVFINRTFDASVDLQEAFLKIAQEITDKEDELDGQDTD